MTSPLTQIEVKRLPHGQGLPLPSYQTPGAAGIDLLAALSHGSKVVLEPGGRDLVPTGIALSVPQGFEAQVRPRSGLARDFGVTVLNSPGTIDSDYRGEIMVLLVNLGREPFEIMRGARIAQLVVTPVARAELVEKAELSGTARASGGFGSTGGVRDQKEEQ